MRDDGERRRLGRRDPAPRRAEDGALVCDLEKGDTTKLAAAGWKPPERFVAKGRFERRMEAIPVKLVTYPQPGLYGAAVAFAKEFA